ncbi:MAG: hypothetical protein LBS01_03510 [Prevotellaceae bacterium]|jgi:hypothetical protein|nr:hypothetical protein [Prevotellaceae bacterium]
MKKLILACSAIFCILVAIAFTPDVKKCNCDYISSGYYQLIYEADIAYLSGDRNTAFEKITEAKLLCPLIQQRLYSEISKYMIC